MPTVDFECRVRESSNNIQTSDSIHACNKEFLRDYERNQVLKTDFEDWLECTVRKSPMINDKRVDSTVSINVERKKLSREEIRQKLREGEKLHEELI